ncbi:MAG: hypothetical protein KJP00_12235, partial [Bacteroidia bacterium]|nr:hypothetical protein [Bacteroidia bacterium]
VGINAQAKEYLKSYLEFIFDIRDKYFGNARTVRQIVDEAIKNMNLRLADIPKKERTKSVVNTLTLADVEQFKKDKEEGIFAKKQIGFRSKR